MSRLIQLIIAMAGLSITMLLHLGSQQNQQEQARQAYVAQFTQTLGQGIETCNDIMIGLAAEAAAELDSINGDEAYANRVAQVRGTCGNPEAREEIVASAPAQEAPAAVPAPQAQLEIATSNLELQSQEILPRSERASAGRYYAVLASYALGDNSTYDPVRGAAAHYNTLVEATRGADVTVRMFRTSISSHIAIVLEPQGQTEEGARTLMTQARSAGWSPDAFVQQERRWVACSNPGTIEGVRACGR